MEAFVQMIETGTMKEGSSDVRSALQSHYMAFAAEESRKKANSNFVYGGKWIMTGRERVIRGNWPSGNRSSAVLY